MVDVSFNVGGGAACPHSKDVSLKAHFLAGAAGAAGAALAGAALGSPAEVFILTRRPTQGMERVAMYDVNPSRVRRTVSWWPPPILRFEHARVAARGALRSSRRAGAGAKAATEPARARTIAERASMFS